MTFTYASKTHNGVPKLFGTVWANYGTFTNGSSDCGGDIQTQLSYVEAIFLQPTGTSALASQPVYNETLPKTGGDVTIVTTKGVDGVWLALGRN